MSEEQISMNYETLTDHNIRIWNLEKKIEMLDERITKLETIIVELYNTDITDEDIDWAEVAMMRRDNEDDEE